MKKIIRLTESDLNRLVKKIITEQNDNVAEKIENIINRAKNGGELGIKNPDIMWLRSNLKRDRTGRIKDALNQIMSIKRDGSLSQKDSQKDALKRATQLKRDRALSQNGGKLPPRRTPMGTSYTSGYENDGQLLMLHQKNENEVRENLTNLNRNIKFIAIIDCEYADFSNVDICSLKNLSAINLKNTPNNYEEQDYECGYEMHDGYYSFND